MGISDKDRELMDQVTAFFQSTKDEEHPKGSIRETSIEFGINRNKVRKILITSGEITSPITEQALKLRQEGFSIEEVAEKLDVSTATVSTYLPYDDRIRNSLDPGEHAKAVREYRAYEREQAKRQVTRRMKEEGKAGGVKINMDGKKRAVQGKTRKMKISWAGGVKRLHMELVYNLEAGKHEMEVLKSLGDVRYGETISRDVVVPVDMPLYAVHYMMQRLFGWQNSHLHKFEMAEEEMKRLTENKAGIWGKLVGVIFRSSIMPLEDEYWADDYESGSIKNWFMRKYTGPYRSLCKGEGYLACRADMKRHYSRGDWYVRTFSDSEDGTESVIARPVEGPRGRNDPPDIGHRERLEILPFDEVPVEAMQATGDSASFDILERLPIGNVLTTAPSKITGSEILQEMAGALRHMEEKGDDAPELQPWPPAFTDTLYYEYDFGCIWTVKITMTDDCEDLIQQGRISRADAEKAVAKCRELYRPVSLAADGEMVMDDVGGVSGFVEFLEAVYPDVNGLSPEEIMEAEEEKAERLSWSKWVGWKRLKPMI